MVKLSLQAVRLGHRDKREVMSVNQTQALKKELQIFATNMKMRRKELGYSQDRLGKEAGLHRTFVGGIEQLKRNPSTGSCVKIAQALGVDLA